MVSHTVMRVPTLLFAIATALVGAGCSAFFGTDFAFDSTSDAGDDAAAVGSGGGDAAGPPQGGCTAPAIDCAGKCGHVVDACGTAVDCGGCAAGQTCGGAGPNTCGSGSCTPSCAGKACGADDGCGKACDAGTCAAGLRCVSGACACDPTSCKGCCSAAGCEAGGSFDTCGSGGAACQRCADAQVCGAGGACRAASWHAEPSGTSESLNAVWQSGGGDVYVVGATGTILRS